MPPTAEHPAPSPAAVRVLSGWDARGALICASQERGGLQSSMLDALLAAAISP